MKKFLLITSCFLLTAFSVHAQKYAIIDTRYILDRLPEYKQSQQQLDAIAADWQKEIDAKQAELDKMYKDYDAEQVMLSDDLKKKEKTSFFRKKKSLEICSASGLVLKATCSKKDRNLSNPFRIKYITLSKRSPQNGAMILC